MADGYGTLHYHGADIELIALFDSGPIIKVSAKRAWRVDPYVSETNLAKWTGRQKLSTSWITYLDHTVQATEEIDVNNPAPAKAITEGLKELERDGRKFEKEFKGKRHQISEWNKEQSDPPVDEHAVVDEVQQRDMWYLTSQWGWQYYGPFGASSPGWVFPIQLGDKVIRFRELQSMGDGKTLPGFSMEWDVPIAPLASVTEFVAGINQKLHWSQAGPSGKSGYVYVGKRYDISSPVTVESIHQAIRKFAEDVDLVELQARRASSDGKSPGTH